MKPFWGGLAFISYYAPMILLITYYRDFMILFNIQLKSANGDAFLIVMGLIFAFFFFWFFFPQMAKAEAIRREEKLKKIVK